MHFENIYRIEKGLAVRIKYAPKKDGSFLELTSNDIIKNIRTDYKLSTEAFKNNNNDFLIKK